MHSKDVDNYTLKCSFCRNDIPEGSNKNSKPLIGEFITVLCDGCVQVIKDNPKGNLEPKYAICLCSDTPREMETWMAYEETAAKGNSNKDNEVKESVSFKPVRSTNKKVSDL